MHFNDKASLNFLFIIGILYLSATKVKEKIEKCAL
nr:MAG TPA: hypothetical protein [Bacteriophage sp.]